jgi:hypothetical protein
MTPVWILPVFPLMLAGTLAGAVGRELGEFYFFGLFLCCGGDGVRRGGRRGWVIRGVCLFPLFTYGSTSTTTSTSISFPHISPHTLTFSQNC